MLIYHQAWFQKCKVGGREECVLDVSIGPHLDCADITRTCVIFEVGCRFDFTFWLVNFLNSILSLILFSATHFFWFSLFLDSQGYARYDAGILTAVVLKCFLAPSSVCAALACPWLSLCTVMRTSCNYCTPTDGYFRAIRQIFGLIQQQSMEIGRLAGGSAGYMPIKLTSSFLAWRVQTVGLFSLLQTAW